MSQHTPSLSFEVFPPNPEVGNAKLLRALANMQELAPHFISVTASNNKYNIKFRMNCLFRPLPTYRLSISVRKR